MTGPAGISRSRPIVLAALLGSAAALPGASSLPATAARPPAAGAITLGEKHIFHSKVLGEDRPYWVYLPNSYDRHAPFAAQRYPTLYLLDGDGLFQTGSALVRHMGEGINFNLQVPPHIVVAIPNLDRMRDMTPTASKEYPGSGGSPAFLRFLEKELVPHIDSTYRTLPFRTLVGHSLSGLCAVDAMLAARPTFQAFLAMDPSVWWDDALALKRARAALTPNDRLRSTVYLAWSGGTPPSHQTDRAFADLVTTHTAPGYEARSQVFPEEDHGSLPLMAMYQGLQFILSGWRPDLRGFEQQPAAIATHYQRVSRRIHCDLLPPEELVDLVGRHAQPDQALQCFRLNVTNYPDSAHAHEALAEACRARGDVREAIAHYQRCLQLDPGNAKAGAALEELNRH